MKNKKTNKKITQIIKLKPFNNISAQERSKNTTHVQLAVLPTDVIFDNSLFRIAQRRAYVHVQLANNLQKNVVVTTADYIIKISLNLIRKPQINTINILTLLACTTISLSSIKNIKMVMNTTVDSIKCSQFLSMYKYVFFSIEAQPCLLGTKKIIVYMTSNLLKKLLREHASYRMVEYKHG